MNVPKLLEHKLIMNEPMKNHTIIGIGGRALYYIGINSFNELNMSLDWADTKGLHVHVLGKGSNILVSDYGVDGLVLNLEGEEFNSVEKLEDTTVRAGSCCSLKRVIRYAVQEGIGGLETLAGIPGSVGGALWMNAGGKYGDIASLVQSVRIRDSSGTVTCLAKKDIGFSYRKSHFNPEDIILDATFKGISADPDELENRYKEIIHEKSQHQPLGLKSCGCVFKNPPGDSAGRLIDSAGFKGRSVGDIEVSKRHANFLINRGDGCSRDMVELMSEIYDSVLKKTGIALEPEIVMWGDNRWEDILQ